MTKIFLIRHGETEWNKTARLQGNSDIKLAEEGIRQAQLLAKNVSFSEVAAVYSSDLIRAVNTAKILADRVNLPVIEKPGLREANFGDWEGKYINALVEEFPDDFGKFFINPDNAKPPGGETFLECQARVMNALDEIVADHENQNIIVVSHGAAIRLIICAALEIRIRKMWSISQFNTAVNILIADEGTFRVELLNSTAHLYTA